MTVDTKDVVYLVLPDATNPAFLARVRWPDVYQAMSPARPYWQDDPGLFDLPYDPSSTPLSSAEATALAAQWGARLHSDDTATSVRSLIRRMPANWSNLSPAEISAWSIEFTKPSKRAAAEASSRGKATRRRPWRRRKHAPVLDTGVIDLTGTPDHVIDLTAGADDVIDLTGTKGDDLATAEDA